MSPLDDELRAALQSRASSVPPSPDPLAGIERRATRMRRNRVAASVVGSALAVAAVATAVPVLQGAGSPAPVPRDLASTAPSASPSESSAPTTTSYGLDPERPWAYRGEPLSGLGPGTLDTIEREYATKRRAPSASVTPLFARRSEPSGQLDLVFLAEVGGGYRWGVATPGEAGPEFRWDESLKQGQAALAAALTDAEGPARLLVVAAPGTSARYAPDQTRQFIPMAALADGVALTPLEGDPATDVYQVTGPGGGTVTQADAPDAPGTTGGGTGEPPTALDPDAPWPVRGDPSLVTEGQLTALGEDWAARHDVEAADVDLTPLYVQRDPDGGVEVAYLVRSAGGPWSWGVSALGEGGWSWYVDRPLQTGTAALVGALPGSDVRVLLIAAPSTGAGLYAEDGRDFRPMDDLAPGVFGTMTGLGRDSDRYRVLDGDGDLDAPVATGLVPAVQNAG